MGRDLLGVLAANGWRIIGAATAPAAAAPTTTTAITAPIASLAFSLVINESVPRDIVRRHSFLRS